MSAEIQWNRVRVASPMPPACPAHTDTDNNITLPAANPATAKAINRRRSSPAPVCSVRPESKGAAGKPSASTRSITALADVSASRHSQTSRRVLMLTRAWVTPGMASRAVSMRRIQAAQWMFSTIR